MTILSEPYFDDSPDAISVFLKIQFPSSSSLKAAEITTKNNISQNRKKATSNTAHGERTTVNIGSPPATEPTIRIPNALRKNIE
jgi:hypothetical protein